MFGTLLESRARRERGGKGTALSVVIHAALIALAIVATASARTPTIIEPERVVDITPPAPAIVDPVPDDAVGAVGPVAPESIGDAPVIEPPTDVPTRIPDIDVTAPATHEPDFRGGARRPGERPAGDPTAGTTGNPMFDFQVDKPVVAAGGCAPRYPETLKSVSLEGEVLAQFVVNEEGRAVPGSFKVLRSTNELFTHAVRACLPSLKFWPAEAGARRVSQLVQQPFVFALERR